MNHLKTDNGLSVEVIRPGEYNTGAGPDFFNAKLKIDDTLWAGNVEIHIHSSDWHRHNHHHDPVYDSCILHVVFDNDTTTFRMNGTAIPSIELKNKFPPYLWENYLRLIGTRGWVSCQPRIKEIDEFTWRKTLDGMIHERLEQRAQQIFIALKGNKDDWEECFYQLLAKNFGFRLNAMPFEMLARSLPLKYIRKEGDQIINVEALIFGQAGMLSENFQDAYPEQLYKAYLHLAQKYSLKNIPVSSWKLLRLRPVNFPAIRISQFACLLTTISNLFSALTNASSLNELSSIFKIQASEYWNTHYHFRNESSFATKRLGSTSINNLLINTCIPFLFAWGKYIGDISIVERSLSFLNEIPAEENHMIQRWKETGVFVNSAVDSQALLQLKILHCAEKKCITCNIGNKLINELP